MTTPRTTTSKAAVEGLTQQLALEFAPKVRVNAIAPGPALVDRNVEYSPNFEAEWEPVIPLGRVAHPHDDLIGPFAFLASDESRYITGQILNVDGGLTIRSCTPDLHSYQYQRDRQQDGQG